MIWLLVFGLANGFQGEGWQEVKQGDADFMDMFPSIQCHTWVAKSLANKISKPVRYAEQRKVDQHLKTFFASIFLVF